MEAIKELLEKAKPYQKTYSFGWKIKVFAEKTESFTEAEVIDISRQFKDISEVFLIKVSQDRLKYNHSEILLMKSFLEFSSENSRKDFKVFAEINLQLLSLLEIINKNEINFLNFEVYITEYERRVATIKSNKTEYWKKLITVVNRILKHFFTRKNLPRPVCEEVLDSISKRVNLFSDIDLTDLLNYMPEMKSYISYVIISEKIGGKLKVSEKNENVAIDQLHKKLKLLFDAVEFEKFEEAKSLILSSKNNILQTLTSKLVGDYQKLLEPRRNIKDSSFAAARKLINSPNENERLRGYETFRDLYRKNEKYFQQVNYKQQLAKEWLNFAEYKINAIAGLRNWETEVDNNIASWETRWNLAVVYLRAKQPHKALKALTNISKAPFIHLKFGLYVALEMYKTQNTVGLEHVNYLSEHLTKLPISECYLAHLLIKLEENKEFNLIEYPYLENYTKVSLKKVVILDPKANHQYDTIVSFQQELLDLELLDTWLIWTKDYAENHYFQHYAWKLLSEAYIRKNDKINAENALKHNISIRVRPYEEVRNKEVRTEEARNLRLSLIDLFDFYVRQALNDSARAALLTYRSKFKELWDFKNPDNKKLIGITRKFMPKEEEQSDDNEKRDADSDQVWNNLIDEIAKINKLQDLFPLGERLNQALNVIKVDTSNLQEKKAFFIELLTDFAIFDHEKLAPTDLHSKLSDLSLKLKVATDIINSYSVFRKLKPLRSAYLRIFENLNKSLNSYNRPIIDNEIFGIGLPDDVTSTSLLIRIENTGMGPLENIAVLCRSNNDLILSSSDYKINKLKEREVKIAAIPIKLKEDAANLAPNTELKLTFTWETLKDLVEEKHISLKWFSFVEYIHNFERNNHEFIKLYVDAEIDFNQHDNNIFQGREQEIKLVKSKFLISNDFQPIYFHGTRKVGKTSLLKRIELELQSENFTYVYVMLISSIDPNKGLDSIINILINWITIALRRKNINILDWENDKTIAIDTLAMFELFIEKIFQHNGNKRFIIIFDEFQHLVHQSTSELLDLFRRLTNSGLVTFILSGLLRPEVIRTQTSSQFSFVPFAVDFLDIDAIQNLLTKPVKNIGIEFHPNAITAVRKMTAGNPFFISKIAQYCTDLLNLEHRNLIVEDDIIKVATIISKEEYIFKVSVLTNLVLTPEDIENVILVAKEISDNDIGVPINKIREIVEATKLTMLQQKYLIEVVDENIKIKGDMLWLHLKNNIAAIATITNSISQSPAKKIGLFIDYENVLRNNQKENQNSLNNRLAKLIDHYSKLGSVVCRWAAAYSFPHDVKLEFQKAGFIPMEHSGVTKWENREKDVADFILIEAITEETELSQPDIFVILAGDIDYFIKIQTLNRRGSSVRLAGYKNRSHINNKYFEYEEDRRAFTLGEGGTLEDLDFVIDDLDEIFV